MKCPKCGAEQADAAQCASCGIYIAKYEAYLRQKTIGRPISARDIERKPPGMRGIVIAGFVVLIGFGWLALGGHKGSAEVAATPVPVVVAEDVSGESSDAPVPGACVPGSRRAIRQKMRSNERATRRFSFRPNGVRRVRDSSSTPTVG